MTAEQVRENRLRRMAERQGLQLVKSRRRDPRALDFGTFTITRGGATVAGPGLSVDQAEDYLTNGPH
ncbi:MULTISPECIES: hypothetical protein [Nocardioides]|uniref:Uncharacterized protein n=1 Tax=Nocardioides vastitatis TaxID=2568655 RepID=A0ABW0ZKC4_9ACTN|nr:hypothetical protein [Nocardioides sp.]THJ13710.1 hypothetical protein E7Z54_01495 [Nocardioides sp.]